MSTEAVKKAPKKRGAKAHKLPDPISAGEVLTDLKKRQWILDKSVGVGGFGEVYSAAPYSGTTPKEFSHVIKIEPHENGPLFVEMHFYMRNAKPDEIDSWKKKKNLKCFGMPKYIASGSHQYKNTKYRFIVMDRYGTNLWKLFEENNKKFPEPTVYKIALQIVNILEYIHHKGYVHADVKGANLLLGLKTPDQVYLVDFGLASHYTTKNECKLDPKKAHNGTIEYTSRDAHIGVPTMRGDLEILGYNMIHWLTGSLLWEKNLSDPVAVQKQKEKAFDNISEFLNNSFNGSVPNTVLKFMILLSNMNFNDKPDHDEFTKILKDGLKELSHKPDGKLEFKSDSNSYKTKVMKSPLVKVKKPIDKTKKSPRAAALKNSRIKALKDPSPVNLDDSNVGIIIDKKRAELHDIKEILNDIESGEEYDVKIVKKSKKQTISEDTNKSTIKKTPVKRKRTVRNHRNDSGSDSEQEITPKGTRSRPISSRNTRATNKKSSNTPKVRESASDEDIFL